ncbi:MAG: hypothetical protein UV64_C0033G0006 [Parcubacteria group bacterium GW2011_GWC1_43_11b]|nr:MAG: hypothetical protein UV64_C0033G0006 [Parcubacteria group bacterium GW2011_GWC1_43_11b]
MDPTNQNPITPGPMPSTEDAGVGVPVPPPTQSVPPVVEAPVATPPTPPSVPPAVQTKPKWGKGALVGAIGAVLVLVVGVFVGTMVVSNLQNKVNLEKQAGLACSTYSSDEALCRGIGCEWSKSTTEVCNDVDVSSNCQSDWNFNQCSEVHLGCSFTAGQTQTVTCSGLSETACNNSGCTANYGSCARDLDIQGGLNACSYTSKSSCEGDGRCIWNTGTFKSCTGGTKTTTSPSSCTGTYKSGTTQKCSSIDTYSCVSPATSGSSCTDGGTRGYTRSINASIGVTSSDAATCYNNCQDKATCQLMISGFKCNSNDSATEGCQDNPRVIRTIDVSNNGQLSSCVTASFDTSWTCGSQQVDILCQDKTGVHNNNGSRGYLAFMSTAAATACTTAETPPQKTCNQTCTATSECQTGLTCDVGRNNTCWAASCETPPPPSNSASCQRLEYYRDGALLTGGRSDIRVGDVITVRGFASVNNTTVSNIRFTVNAGGVPQVYSGTGLQLVGGLWQADSPPITIVATSYSISATPIFP